MDFTELNLHLFEWFNASNHAHEMTIRFAIFKVHQELPAGSSYSFCQKGQNSEYLQENATDYFPIDISVMCYLTALSI